MSGVNVAADADGSGDTVEVAWAEDGAVTRIAFGPGSAAASATVPGSAPTSVSVEHGTR